MVYWVSFSKTGIGEVIRERSYDSIVKARRYAANVLKRKEFQWAGIHSNKDTRYHLETIEFGFPSGTFTVSRFTKGPRRFTDYTLNADGTLGKKLR